MTPYLVLNASVILFLFSLRNSSNELLKKASFTLVFLFSLTLLAFRGESVGVDTTNYYELVSRFFRGDSLISYGIEPLFIFYSYISKGFALGEAGVIALISLSTILPLYLAIYKTSLFPGLSLFLYITLGFYSMSFNIATQMSSVAILVLASYYLLVKSSYFLFFALSIISVSMHYSALVAVLIMLTIYLLKGTIIKRFFFLWLFSLVLLIFPEIIVNFFGALKGFLTIYASYADWYENRPLNFRFLFFNLLVVFIFLNLGRIKRKSDNFAWFSIICFSLSVILSNIFHGYEVIARITLFFQIYSLIVIPFLLKIFLLGKERAIFYLFVILLGSAFFVKSLLLNSGGIVPYNFL